MGQIENKNLFLSPNAASLGLFGQIPVDNFTGVPAIDIPVYEFKSRDLSIPIHMSYHAAGIKPSDHASWVGLGWSLQAGGVINRIQNDLPDELMDYTFGPGVPRGFFFKYGGLAASNWNSSDSLVNAEYSEAYRIVNPTTNVAHGTRDYAPDEFQFSFLGMSGSLTMGTDGKWHLKSKQGLNFSVQTEIGTYVVWEPNNPSLLTKNQPSMVRTCLTKFILTAADGTRYSFGTDTVSNNYGYNQPNYTNHYFTTPDSNAVEFSRVGPGYGNGYSGARDGGTVPVSWYLTKINSPTGDSIVLRYTRDGYQVIANTVAFGSYSQCSSGCASTTTLTYGAGDNVSLLDGSTLASITGANGTITFNKSKANVMDYSLLGNSITPNNEAWYDGGNSGVFVVYGYEMFQGQSNPNSAASTFMQLDSIVVTNNASSRVKAFKFTYNSGPYNRLFLNSFQPVSTDSSTVPPYTFSYNNSNGLYKVPYGTMSVDCWGYYTGKNSFNGLFSNGAPTNINPYTQTGNAYYTTITNGISALSAFNYAFDSIYIANRATVPDSMQYGILTKITYPTGGNSQFVWEPNTYSKYIKVAGYGDSITTPDLHATKIGGGLRIKKITSQANYTSPPLSKTYLYVRDYINHDTVCSGVLNSSLPQYVDSFYQTGSFYTRIWQSNEVQPTYYTDGSPVTYTHVTEVDADSGMAVYTYANHDNGYQDRPKSAALANNYTNTGSLWQQVNTCSMELERGLLLNQGLYKAGAVLVKNMNYQYNTDTSRLTTPVRKYHYDRRFSLAGATLGFDEGGFLTITAGPPIYFGDVVSALNTYIQYPYLAGVTQTDYDQNGANPLVITTSYTYDTLRNKKTQVFTSSKGETIIDTFNYAKDAISGLSTAAQQAKTAMVAANMVGISLEKTRSIGGTQTTHSRTDYQVYTSAGSILVPANSYVSYAGASLDSLTHYLNYDNKGNILEYLPRSGLPQSVDWGYNQVYPTVKISNAYNLSGAKAYYYDGFEENSNGAVVSGTAHTGGKYWGGSTYTTLFTPPDSKTYLIEWWNLVSGSWHYNRQTYTSGMTLTGPVDDVRIFPTTSLMSTYTYIPLIGMASEINGQGLTTYYIYDGLGRLSAIKDKDGNIIKTVGYHYQGQ